MRTTGHYERLGNTDYFIPDPLPPQNPPLTLDTQMLELYGDAMLQLGRLNEMIQKLPDLQRFIKDYVVKEAILSSSIEGIHTTLLDVFTQPLLESKPSKETQLVMNYTTAAYEVVSMVKNGLAISSRVILKAHELLMQGEGNQSNPGHYRKQSVSVGNLIPPPSIQIPQLMADLELFINNDITFQSLIKAGLAHVQFETIHPFSDGNGRIGRLLIVLILVENGLLTEPILYPSYYFKKHHLEYYQKLDRVRTHGDFEGWITYYLTAIKESSIDAYKRAKDIEALEEQLGQDITKQKPSSSKSNETRLQALSVLFRYPIISISALSSQLNISYNTANQIISNFLSLGILVEETGQKRGKLFKFKQYLAILEKEYAE